MVKPRLEFVHDPNGNTTLILVWIGMRVVHRENVVGKLSLEDKLKWTKKLKRKYKVKEK